MTPTQLIAQNRATLDRIEQMLAWGEAHDRAHEQVFGSVAECKDAAERDSDLICRCPVAGSASSSLAAAIPFGSLVPVLDEPLTTERQRAPKAHGEAQESTTPTGSRLTNGTLAAGEPILSPVGEASLRNAIRGTGSCESLSVATTAPTAG